EWHSEAGPTVGGDDAGRGPAEADRREARSPRPREDEVVVRHQLLPGLLNGHGWSRATLRAGCERDGLRALADKNGPLWRPGIVTRLVDPLVVVGECGPVALQVVPDVPVAPGEGVELRGPLVLLPHNGDRAVLAGVDPQGLACREFSGERPDECPLGS